MYSIRTNQRYQVLLYFEYGLYEVIVFRSWSSHKTDNDSIGIFALI